MVKNIKNFLPLIVLLALIILVYITNLHQEFTLNRLRLEQERLLHYVHSHPILSPILFVGIYTLSVCLVIPDSILLTLLGGFVFPLPLAIIYSVFSETLGATIFFWVFYAIFKNTRVEKERPFFKKMRIEFNHYKANYLLFFRLSHIFPFWLINICAAYFKVHYWTFIWTCVVGVIPLSFLLSEGGNKLSTLFKNNESVTLSDLFSTQMKLILFGLGLLSLIPIVYNHFLRRRK